MTHGGKREGAGRKPKATEQKLIERLSPLDDIAFNQLQSNILDGEKWAIELFFKYRYGMPKQMIETKHEFNQTLDNITSLYSGKDSEA